MNTEMQENINKSAQTQGDANKSTQILETITGKDTYMKMSGKIAKIGKMTVRDKIYNYYLLEAYYADNRPLYYTPVLLNPDVTVPIFNIKEAIANNTEVIEVSQKDLKVGDCIYTEGVILQTKIPTVGDLTKREYYLLADVFKIRNIEYTSSTRINYIEGTVNLLKLDKSLPSANINTKGIFYNIIKAEIVANDKRIPVVVHCKTDKALTQNDLNPDKSLRLLGFFNIDEKKAEIRGNKDTRQTFIFTTYSIKTTADIKSLEI